MTMKEYFRGTPGVKIARVAKATKAITEYERGFERAILLVFGNGVKWTDAERRIGNRVTRKLFGKKRR